MKINHNHISQLCSTEEFFQLISKDRIDRYNNLPDGEKDTMITVLRDGESGVDYIKREYRNLLNKPKKFIITKSALNVIERIKMNKLDLAIFNKLEINKSWEFSIDENTLFKGHFDGTILRGIHVTKEMVDSNGGKTIVTYNTFSFNTQGRLFSQNYDEIKDIADSFLKILIFINFAELECVMLKPNGKYGSVLKGNIKNDTKFDYIIVNSKWNIMSIRTEGFKVSGHFRLQPCGVSMQDRRLIYIDEFAKSGYIRGAKKTILN